MSEEKIIQPPQPLPQPDDTLDNVDELVKKYTLDYSRDYPEPHYMLKFGDVAFSPLGGLQAITGHQKNGKTFVLAMLMAAVLQPDSERVKSFLYGLTRVQETVDYLGHEPIVLYVDTEMEQLNSAKVARRVQWLCGWPYDQLNPRFRQLWLRSVDDDKDVKSERYKIIKGAIEMYKPDFVVIDGIVDIVHDYNDNEESGEIISQIMNIASKNDICIWTALHQNPGGDTLSKMRGHLGTELANKSSDTLVSVKEKKNGEVKFTVKQINARGKDMDDFKFVVTDDAGALGVPKILDEMTEQQKKEYEDQQELIKIDDVFHAYPGWSNKGSRYTDIMNFLRSSGISSNRVLKDYKDKALDAGIIFQGADKKYYYNGLNKPVKNDESENLPFPPAGDKAEF